MNGSVQYSTLTRLLALNNESHDLQNRLLEQPLGPGGLGRIAEMQDQIAQVQRASLATCWLDDSDDEDAFRF